MLDHGLRPGRPAARPRRARHELPRADRRARPDGRAGRAAGAAGGPDRRPRRRRADGGVRDPRRAARGRAHGGGAGRRRRDGRRRAVLAGARRGALLNEDGRRARRRAGCSSWPAAWPATGRTHAPTAAGWRSARWSRSSGRRGVAAPGARICSTSSSPRPGSAGHAAVEAVFASRTRAEWEAFAAEHECCLDPVLDLGEALSSQHVRARGMVVGLDQPGAAQPVSLLGAPVQALAHAGGPQPPAGAAAGRAHRGGAARAPASTPTRIAQLVADGAVAGPPDPAAPPGGSFRA